MPPRRRLALAAATVAALATVPGHARAPVADLGVTASFDRRSVLPGQVAVAELRIRNRGPEGEASGTLRVTVEGGTLLRARGDGVADCRLQRGGRRATCRVRARAFGIVGVVTVHARAPARRGLVRVRATITSPGDENAADDRAVRAIRVIGTAPPGFAELSFELDAPGQVVVGQAFAARIRLFGRGPATVELTTVSLTTTPAALVRMPITPARLRPGDERTFVARVTPRNAGRHVLELRVGRTGLARLDVVARPVEE